MSSRKKLTIALVSIVAIAVVAIVALVSVLAATKQTIKSSFKVYYEASQNVVAEIDASYEFTKIQDSAVTEEISEGSNSVKIESNTTTPGTLLDIADRINFNKDNENEQSLVFKFTIKNTGSFGFRATLSIKDGTGSTTYNDNSFKALNLVATYWDGDSWESVLDKHFDISGVSYGGTAVDHIYFVQIYVNDMDHDVNGGNEASFQLHWDLDSTAYGS